MAISAEELNIILSAKDREFNKAMDRANKKIQRFAHKSKTNLNQTTKAMDKLSISAGKLGGLLSVGAISVGFQRMIDNATQASKEITNLSTLAGVSVERFQEMSFAAANFGVSQEKLADILKDTNDKFADFFQTGGGGAVDFFEQIAPKVGLTADAFKGLSSDEGLALYVKALEDANVNQQEMTFFMEALASDATLLVPLFQDNAKAMGEMSERARELGLVLSNDTVLAGVEMRRRMDEILDAMGKQFSKFALTALEAFDAIFQMTDKARMDSLYEQQIKLEEKVLKKRQAIEKFKKAAFDTEENFNKKKQIMIDNLVVAEIKLAGVQDERMKLLDQEEARTQLIMKMEKARNSKGTGFSPIDPKDVKKATAELKIMNKTLEDLDSMASTLESAFEDVFMSAIEGSKSFKDTLKSSAQAIIRELYRILVVQRLVNATMSFLGIGTPVPNFSASVPTTASAGGNYLQAGQPSVVGEHGREIFVPSTAGRVLSVGQAQSAISGGDGVTINQTINVTTGVQQTVRNEIKTMLPQIAESAKAAVVDSKRRGGSFGRAFS
ncbi:MAG: hypothetical protein CMA66_00960 [Euryarchaeota archaeon]|jgi:hypothetical protein|nr:hypothetical protein [Euryarchaeota archaeon]|tara:strand:- start:3992 stop:5656 length:1665 start_codon:yes stop_codon:yes gene_type:complete